MKHRKHWYINYYAQDIVMMLSTTSEVLDKIKTREGREQKMLFYISSNTAVGCYTGKGNKRMILVLIKKKPHQKTTPKSTNPQNSASQRHKDCNQIVFTAFCQEYCQYCLWIISWSCGKMDAVQLQHSFNEKWHHKSRVYSCSQAAYESWDLGYSKSYWLWHLPGNEISIVGFKLRYLRMLLYLKQMKANFYILLQTENDWIVQKYLLLLLLFWR